MAFVAGIKTSKQDVGAVGVGEVGLGQGVRCNTSVTGRLEHVILRRPTRHSNADGREWLRVARLLAT